ncbi:hypothetical protein KR009_010155 [Drosophila setifemur]|nr:hypothetical protein KR009_010155 [Drosophila setifemur]
MSRLKSREDVPRDMDMVQDLRREINRNSQDISFNFWQEFEHIRTTQRNRLENERMQRERISTMMRAGEQESTEEAEALSRSISAHGMTRVLPLPSPLQIEPTRPTSAIRNVVRNVASRLNPTAVRRVQHKPRFQMSKSTKSKARSNNEKEPPVQPSPVSLNIPRAPPTSRATMISSNISNRAIRDIAKYRLANKPKK